MNEQFDSCAQGGWPFTREITEGKWAGAVDDTQIGKTVSIILDWSCRQLDRVVAALADAPADLLNLSMKAEVLLFYAGQSEGWDAVVELAGKLRDEEAGLRAVRKAVKR